MAFERKISRLCLQLSWQNSKHAKGETRGLPFRQHRALLIKNVQRSLSLRDMKEVTVPCIQSGNVPLSRELHPYDCYIRDHLLGSSIAAEWQLAVEIVAH